jgi:Mrp family chromosome partitioning ATPase
MLGPDLDLLLTRMERDLQMLDQSRSVAGSQADVRIAASLGTRDADPAASGGMSRQETDLRDNVEQHFRDRFTGVGQHTADLVLEWVHQRLTERGAQAARTELERRRDDLRNENQRYAELGSSLSRIEREIGVAEQEYLERLRSLDVARLYQQQLTERDLFQIVDPVTVPLEPRPARRTMTAALAGAIALVGLALGVIGVAYFDRSLRRVSDFETAYGLPVLGGIPFVPDVDQRPSPADLDEATLFGRFVATLNVPAGAGSVQVVGCEPACGKSTVARLLSAQIAHRDRHAVVIHDRPDLSISTAALDGSADASILVVRSGSTYRRADRRFVEQLATAGSPVYALVINRIDFAAAEELIGSIPRPRSRLREWVKRLLSMQFGGPRVWRLPADATPPNRDRAGPRAA